MLYFGMKNQQTPTGGVFHANFSRLSYALQLFRTVLAQTKKLRLSGLGELMDGIFLSEELGAEKPNAAFFDQVFEAIEETDRKKILIVGDSLTSDIRGGNLAQIVTCWYNPNGQKADSTYRIDAQIQDLQEVIPLLSQSW